MKNHHLLKEHKSWVCSDSSVIESQHCQTICVNRLRGEKNPQTFLFSRWHPCNFKYLSGTRNRITKVADPWRTIHATMKAGVSRRFHVTNNKWSQHQEANSRRQRERWERICNSYNCLASLSVVHPVQNDLRRPVPTGHHVACHFSISTASQPKVQDLYQQQWNGWQSQSNMYLVSHRLFTFNETHKILHTYIWQSDINNNKWFYSFRIISSRFAQLYVNELLLPPVYC